jgi:hypothetical protein
MRCQTCSFQLAASAALLITAAMPALLRAQDAPAPDSGVPERGVARISAINGDVSVRRGDSGDWVAAAPNAPVLVDDRIAAGPGSRAEVQFDSANLIRVGANAEIRMAQLDYGRYNIQVAHGTVTFRVFRDSQAQVEVDTPTVSVRPSRIGSYRIYVQDDGETEITVRSGEVEVYSPRGAEPLQAGQTMLARGDPSNPEFRIVPAIAYDEWDRWNTQRDRELQRSTSYRYVPQGVYGTEDMDSYGRWVDVPSYGQVWTPAVAPDWAPYHYGRWVWEDWYGWTWVSYDPWGWAPYHWGRWFYYNPYGWCWYPGGFGVNYWSPALVAFFGFGGGVGVGFGFGNIGWVPLAPFEPFHPWWGRGFYGGYRDPMFFNRNVNITNVNITNIYRNARVANGVAAVRAVDFQQGRFNNISRMAGTQIREAGLVRGQLPVAPGAANLRYSNRAVSNVPRSLENVRFFSRNQAPAVERVPFAQQQRAMQQYSRQAGMPTGAGSRNGAISGGLPGSGPVARQNSGPAARGNSGTVRASSNSGWSSFGRPVDRSASQVNRGSALSGGSPNGSGALRGWRRVDEPAPAQSGGRGFGSPATERNSGWQRFGEPRTAAPSAVPRSFDTGRSAPRSYDPGLGTSGSRWGSDRGAAVPRSGSPAYSAPRYQYSSRPESIRIAPPVVRERSAPRTETRSTPSYGGAGARSGGGYSTYRGGGGYASRGGSGYSAPRSGGGTSSRGGGGASRGGGGGGSHGGGRR